MYSFRHVYTSILGGLGRSAFAATPNLLQRTWLICRREVPSQRSSFGLYAALMVIAGDGKVYNFTALFVCELGR
jgi:hypothetical protein